MRCCILELSVIGLLLVHAKPAASLQEELPPWGAVAEEACREILEEAQKQDARIIGKLEVKQQDGRVVCSSTMLIPRLGMPPLRKRITRPAEETDDSAAGSDEPLHTPTRQRPGP